MVPYWVLFFDIICQVFLSHFPEYVEIILSYSVAYPIKYHVYCCGYFCYAVPFTMRFYSLLSVAIGFGGYEWPIYAREVCMDVTFWKISNNLPNSASVADAMIFLMILHSTCTGLSSGIVAVIGVLDFGPRKNIHLLCCMPLVLRCMMHLNIYEGSFHFFCIMLLFLDVARCNLIILLFFLCFYCWLCLYHCQGVCCH